jgi:hypothetical protein
MEIEEAIKTTLIIIEEPNIAVGLTP